MLVIAVTVAVAVTIAVLVAIAGGAGKSAVKHETHILEFLLRIQTVDFGDHDTLEKAGTDNEDRSIDKCLDDLGVSHHLDRRTVDDHIIIFCSQLGQKIGERIAFKEFRRVGRDSSYRKYRQLLDIVTVDYDRMR